MPNAALDYVATQNATLAKAINYSHPSLTKQLHLGIRHFEIDVLLDPIPGMYAKPTLEAELGQSFFSDTERALLKQPGLKVLHIPDVDVKSHCNLFSQCLTQLLDWSIQHPEHFPLIILMNVKETRVSFIDGQQAIAFTAADYSEIDREIRQVLPANKLFSPDHLRANYASLEEAVLTQGWPELAKLKGKFIFLFDGKPGQTALYAKNHPSLKGRAMFAGFAPGQAESAFLIMNNPLKDFEAIRSAVKQGYMVRTRSDANLTVSNEVRAARKHAAFLSGAHIISSDFYQGSLQAQQAGYSVVFDANSFVRLNPISNAFSKDATN